MCTAQCEGRLVGPTVRQGRPIGRAGSSEARDLISYQRIQLHTSTRIPLFCPGHYSSAVEYIENPAKHVSPWG